MSEIISPIILTFGAHSMFVTQRVALNDSIIKIISTDMQGRWRVNNNEKCIEHVIQIELLL